MTQSFWKMSPRPVGIVGGVRGPFGCLMGLNGLRIEYQVGKIPLNAESLICTVHVYYIYDLINTCCYVLFGFAKPAMQLGTRP